MIRVLQDSTYSYSLHFATVVSGTDHNCPGNRDGTYVTTTLQAEQDSLDNVWTVGKLTSLGVLFAICQPLRNVAE